MLNTRILTLMFVVAFLLVGCLPGLGPGVTPPVTENQAPTITSVHIPTSATVGVAYTYDVNATDPEEEVLTYSLDTKPNGMTIDSTTGLIKWTPTTKGDYAVVVKVSDGTLSDTQSFTIVVSGAEEEEEFISGGGGGGGVPTPPVKLTKIVVLPDTITLFVGQIIPEGLLATYSITAHYSDGSEDDTIDFDDCDYALITLSDIGIDIFTVDPDTGLVTAIAEGTVRIVVYYTKDDITVHDGILVTVTFPEYTYLQLCTVSDGISELTIEQAKSGIYSVKFHAVNWGVDGFALGILTDNIPLNGITALSYWRNGLVYDFSPPAVLLCIDANGDGKLDFGTQEALEVMFAWEKSSLLGDDAILGIEGDWIETGWIEVDGLYNTIWQWGGSLWVDKTGVHAGWGDCGTSFEDFVTTGAGSIDPTDNVMLVVIAGGNPDGDVYIDDITINGETYDLEPD